MYTAVQVIGNTYRCCCHQDWVRRTTYALLPAALDAIKHWRDDFSELEAGVVYDSFGAEVQGMEVSWLVSASVRRGSAYDYTVIRTRGPDEAYTVRVLRNDGVEDWRTVEQICAEESRRERPATMTYPYKKEEEDDA